MPRGDREGPRRFDRYSPGMRPSTLEPLWYHRAHQIAGLIAKVALLTE